jgi:hypothetical protein
MLRLGRIDHQNDISSLDQLKKVWSAIQEVSFATSAGISR